VKNRNYILLLPNPDHLPSSATINDHKLIDGIFLISFNLFRHKFCVFD